MKESLKSVKLPYGIAGTVHIPAFRQSEDQTDSCTDSRGGVRFRHGRMRRLSRDVSHGNRHGVGGVGSSHDPLGFRRGADRVHPDPGGGPFIRGSPSGTHPITDDDIGMAPLGHGG